MQKRTLSALLALVVTLSLLPTAALASEPDWNDTPAVETVKVTIREPGTAVVEVPVGDTPNTVSLNAAVTDTENHPVDNPLIIWNITDRAGNPIIGVSIADGIVTVTADAKEEIDAVGKNLTVTATCGDVNGTAVITVKRAESKAVRAVFTVDGAEYLSDTQTIGIPTGGAAVTKTYGVNMYDQYGEKMDEEAAIEVNAGAALAFNASEKTITVDKSTNSGDSVTLTAKRDDAAAALTVTARAMMVDWSKVNLADITITYGTTNQAAVPLPASGTAAGYDENGNETVITGSFQVREPDKCLEVSGGTKQILVDFAANGETLDTQSISVTVIPKAVIAEVEAVSREYGDVNPWFTAEVSGVLAGDDLGLNLSTAASTASVPGTYDVTGTAANTNYSVTVNGAGKLTITKAVLALPDPIPGLGEIFANDPRNNTERDLLEAVQAASGTLTGTYGANKTAGIAVIWSKTSGVWDRRGGEYTYTAALSEADNERFDWSGSLTLTVAVEPVAAVLTLNKSSGAKTIEQIANAADYAAMGLPDALTVTYSPAAAGAPASYPVTAWSMTVDEIKAAAAAPAALTLTPQFTPDAWAALGAVPVFSLTITDKLPVDITFTAQPADIIYGQTLTAPAAEQTAKEYGTDTTAGAEIIFEYTGRDGTIYNSTTTAPTAAGKYTLTAVLVSDTHAGEAAVDFEIAQKPVTLTWIDPEGLTYDGTAKTVTAAAGDLEDGDECAVFVEGGVSTGAGGYTARATGLSNANYKLPTENLTHTYTIAKADRNLTVTPAALLLLPGEPDGVIKPEYADLDKSARVEYTVTGDAAAITVNRNTGKIAAVGNGTAVVALSIGETANYKPAAAVSCTVTAITQPVLGVSVSSSEEGDLLTAECREDKIVVNGVMSEDAVLTVTPVLYGGLTSETSADGKTLTVKKGETVVAVYAIDTDAVAEKNARIELVEGSTTAVNNVTGSSAAAAESSAKSTKAEGLAASAAQDLLADVQKLETANISKLQETFGEAGYTIRVETGLKVIAEELDLTAGSQKLTLDITPAYTIMAAGMVEGEEKTVSLTGETAKPIANASIKSPVTISAALPAGFPTEDLFARHYLSGGGTEILPVTVTGAEGAKTAVWKQSSFSKTELFSDSRSVTVTFYYADGTSGTVTYTAASEGGNLPDDFQPSCTFNGWEIGGKIYTTVAELLKDLTDAQTAAGSFTETPAGPSPGKPDTSSGSSGSGNSGSASSSGGSAVSTDRNVQNSAAPASTVENDASAEEIETSGKQPVRLPFADVSEGIWYQDAVAYVYERGMMTGVTAAAFAPDMTTSRGMIVTILHRLEGAPAAGAAGFPDVAEGQYYTSAVAWAARNGIVTGYSSGLFGPDDAITREQLAVILYRYAALKGYDTAGRASLSGFPDSGTAGSYAAEALSWAVSAGLLSGMGDGTLAPQGSATRAQSAVILMRFCENVAGK